MRPTKSTFALLAALLLALLTLALAPAREGAKLLINDLFSLSESANAYVYDRLPVAARGTLYLLAILAIAVFGVWGAGYSAQAFIYFQF